MYFDDRLATVLRSSISSERAAQAQFRQLLDLLGTLPEGAEESVVEVAFARLDFLAGEIPARLRATIIRENSARLSEPQLVQHLAAGEAEVAAATIATARLDATQWLVLIPALPVRARGFLRHRRDLGEEVDSLLRRLGIDDLVLTAPSEVDEDIDELLLEDLAPFPAPSEIAEEAPEPDPIPASPAPPPIEAFAGEPEDPHGRPHLESEEIGALVRRIEAFRKARETAQVVAANGAEAPRLPFGEQHEAPLRRMPPAFDFATDQAGRITWTDPAMAPMAVGLSLINAPFPASGAAEADIAPLRETMRRRLPIAGSHVQLDGAPAIEGSWRVDAAPRFSDAGGHFLGYFGRMRRDIPPIRAVKAADDTADRIRQLLHELRTPVNAIQGFAEIIQQQLFGPTPHEYRAMAAAIAGDSARILAGFDELDRLAKLESGVLQPDTGCTDFTRVLAATIEQLGPYLKSRTGTITLWNDEDTVLVGLAQDEAERLAWRLLATLAGALTPGEELDLHIATENDRAIFAIDLPAALLDRNDIFLAAPNGTAAVLNAGMFGAGFTLRLARAEARAIGGAVEREGDVLRLILPLLTESDTNHSHGEGDAGDGLANAL